MSRTKTAERMAYLRAECRRLYHLLHQTHWTPQEVEAETLRGYDAPWRTAYDELVERKAALKTHNAQEGETPMKPDRRKKPKNDEMWSLSQAIDHVQKSLGCDRETAWQALREKLIAGKITAYGIPMPAKSNGSDVRKPGDGTGYGDVQVRSAEVRARQKATE